MLFFVLVSTITKAQITDTSIGLRSGSYHGISARLNYSEPISFEIIFGLKNKGITSTFLLEFNRPLDFFWSHGFNWYYGIGTHFGYMRTNDITDYFNYQESNPAYPNYTMPRSGIDGCIGIRYQFQEIPLEISLDSKPLFEIINVKQLHIQVFETALTIRYKFNNLQF